MLELARLCGAASGSAPRVAALGASCRQARRPNSETELTGGYFPQSLGARHDSPVAFAIAPRSCELAIPFAKSTCPVAAFVTAAARRARQCRQSAGRRFRASPITSCVGTDGTDGRPRPRSPGCRLARGSGHLIAAGTRAAPTRPQREPGSAPSEPLLCLRKRASRRRRPARCSPCSEAAEAPRLVDLDHCDSARSGRSDRNAQELKRGSEPRAPRIRRATRTVRRHGERPSSKSLRKDFLTTFRLTVSSRPPTPSTSVVLPARNARTTESAPH